MPDVHLYADVSNGGVLPTITPASIWLFKHDESMNVCCSDYKGVPYQHKINNEIVETNSATENTAQFNIFPNPASSVINVVSTNLKISTISLYSISGQKLIHKNLYHITDQTHLDVADFPSGIYFLEIIHENGRNNYKIIID